MNETLFKKLCQAKTLINAWKKVKQKGTAGGIDGKTIEDIDADIGNCIRQIQNQCDENSFDGGVFANVIF